MSAHTSATDLTGRVVGNNRYLLLQVIGSGAYGIVYRALDLKVSTSSASTGSSQLAVKVIKKAGRSKSDLQVVRQEVHLHKSVSEHPNVVTVRDAFEDKDYIYIVLDYCPGGDLFGKIVDEGAFYNNDALIKKTFLQILDAVQFCHNKHIYHRDLKPENILCNKDASRVFLADFGMASTSVGSCTFGVGSSFYMSPECIGEDFNYAPYCPKHTDVWALGILLLNMITGRNPWTTARGSDDCFRDYVRNRNFLREMLPISKRANYILRKALHPFPPSRITLPALREAIVALDTFYMSDKELAQANDIVKLAANFRATHIKSELAPSRAGAMAPSLSREPSYFQREDTPVTSPTASVTSLMDDISIADTASTLEESEELFTPATYPVDLDVKVPNLPEEENLGETILITTPKANKPIRPATPHLRGLKQFDSVSA